MPWLLSYFTGSGALAVGWMLVGEGDRAMPRPPPWIGPSLRRLCARRRRSSAGDCLRGIPQARSAPRPKARHRESNHAPGARPPAIGVIQMSPMRSPADPLPCDESSRARRRPVARGWPVPSHRRRQSLARIAITTRRSGLTPDRLCTTWADRRRQECRVFGIPEVAPVTAVAMELDAHA